MIVHPSVNPDKQKERAPGEPQFVLWSERKC
jgi:hypothetical protein